jgi:thiol-disulfide isomerase/thioredoxin
MALALRLAVLALAWVAGGRAASAADPVPIGPGPLVGEPAPAFEVARWLKGEPLDRLAPGRVYVIDLWATWCGPCIGGMPHLSDLQERYAKDITIIGLSSDDPYGSTLAKAEAVLAREGEKIRYRIAWDRDRATYSKWMERESGAGWPWCFVIDRQGRIAWIGHPERLDPVLDRVVAGTWNLDSAAVAYRHRALGINLGGAFYQAYKANHNADAEARYRALRRFDAAYAGDWAPHYFKLLLLRERRRADAYAFVREALDSMLSDRPGELVRIASMVTDSTTPAPLRDLDAALACARRAAVVSPEHDPGTQEVLARVHALRAEWSDAVAAQERAIAQSDSSDAPARAATLARYRARRL